MNYTQAVTNLIETKYNNNNLIVARELKNQLNCDVPESALFKTLERLDDSGQIARLSKGIYYVPQKSKYGTMNMNQKDIVNHFLGRSGKNGLLTGYSLFNKYGITTQISKNVELYSNLITEATKNVGSVKVKKINLNLSSDLANHIEFLEILQNYNKIQDTNDTMFNQYVERFMDNYKNDVIEKVLKSKKYKKSTIAFAEQLLQYYNIQNTLSKHLMKTSKYKIPKLEGIHESSF
ncbi:MAG: hypothetical protein JJE49_03795 [Peptostreptococcaceae bacterium]|nr:hypothetical protein [Peptostreptococcaceae bacterium]